MNLNTTSPPAAKRVKSITGNAFIKTLLFAAPLFILGACAPVDENAISLGYVTWDSEVASTHVVAAVIEDELGYSVSMTSVDAGPLWTGMARGDFDAMVSAWLPSTHEAYYEQTADRVVDLGPNLEGAKIGLVVPADLAVNGIGELNESTDLFGGEITGIDPGAGLMAATERAIEEYELDLALRSSSDAAMTAALDRSVSRGEPIVVTGWIPHWKFAAYDLKFLEDPLNVFGDAEGIHTIVTPELEEKAPEVFTFLGNFHWSAEEMGEVMMSIHEGMDPADAARAWIAENRDRVESWLP